MTGANGCKALDNLCRILWDLIYSFGGKRVIDPQVAVQDGSARVEALTLGAQVVREMIQCVCNEGIVSPVGQSLGTIR